MSLDCLPPHDALATSHDAFFSNTEFTQPELRSAKLIQNVATAIPPTHHGFDVLSIFERSCDWAASEQHAVVTVDHLIFALTEREVGGNALQACGVTGIPELEVELLNVVHRMPIPTLGDEGRPIADNSVLEILNHALGHARRSGRDTSNLGDLLGALLDVLKRSNQDTPGTAALRRRWPQANALDQNLQLLLQMKETQERHFQMIAKAIAEEMATLSNRVTMLEIPKIVEVTPPSPRWHQRLNVLLISFAATILVSAAGAGLWKVIG